MTYIYTWLASGALHLGLGAAVSYLLHTRIEQAISVLSGLFNKVRGK